MNFLKTGISVRVIGRDEPEMVEIRCYEEDENVREIVAFVKSRQGVLSGNDGGNRYEIPVADVIYIESVDSRTFLYTSDRTYETRQKLYELEEQLRPRKFLRISKAMIVNLMKVESLRPALNGRFAARLTTGEDVIVSRSFVPGLKETLRGG